MLCVAAPPSDHETNSYVLPFSDCVAGAPIERTIPSTPTNDEPSASGEPSRRSDSPSMFDASVTVLVRGRTSRVVVCSTPALSRTVRWIWYHWLASTSPVVGIWNDPDLVFVIGPRNGCVC